MPIKMAYLDQHCTIAPLQSWLLVRMHVLCAYECTLHQAEHIGMQKLQGQQGAGLKKQ